MNRNLSKTSWAAFFVVLAGFAVAADSIMFNYQGRVKVQGTPFDGTGQFKFAIVNNPGDVTLWSNDGTSIGGNQPTGYLSIAVADGVFTVMIGDTALGMQPLNSSIFNHPGQIKLRVWFSDGTHGFQQLLPDHRIVNPELIGVMTGDQDFTIYVNGATGKDEDSGLTPARAKKTIQAAVDVLPDRLRCNVTIDIADGVYREQVMVFGIVAQPGKSLTFQGDEVWTLSSPGDPAVRISGKDSDSSTTRVRSNGIVVSRSTGVVVRGVYVEGASFCGIQCSESASMTIKDCKARNNDMGIGCTVYGNAVVRGCLAEYNTNNGIGAWRNSYVTVIDCVSRHNTNCGVWMNEYSTGNFQGTGNYSYNGLAGVLAGHNSYAWFTEFYTGQLNNNDQYGLVLRYLSQSEDHTRNTFSGNGIAATWVDTGSGTYF